MGALKLVAKQCFRCKETKPAEDFAPSKRNKDGLHSYCRSCKAAYGKNYYHTAPGIKDKINARNRERRKVDPAFVQRRKLGYTRWTYNVDKEELWREQGGLCAVCGRPMSRSSHESSSAVVDHDHACCPGKRSCGKCVRGLTHTSCNFVLGSAFDDMVVLQGAIDYLRKHKTHG